MRCFSRPYPVKLTTQMESQCGHCHQRHCDGGYVRNRAAGGFNRATSSTSNARSPCEHSVQIDSLLFRFRLTFLTRLLAISGNPFRLGNGTRKREP